MRCSLGGGDKEKYIEEIVCPRSVGPSVSGALGQGGFTARCATRYESEVGVPMSTYVVGYCEVLASAVIGICTIADDISESVRLVSIARLGLPLHFCKQIFHISL